MAAWREALRLWLTWNRAHEQATARLFKLGEDPQQVEATLDQLDQLRAQAIALSEQVLAEAAAEQAGGPEAGDTESLEAAPREAGPIDTGSREAGPREAGQRDAGPHESAAGDSPTA